MSPKGSGKNHTPLKPPEDSSLIYDESEDISFRVPKLEDMIKGMAIKDDIKGIKEDIKGMVSK